MLKIIESRKKNLQLMSLLNEIKNVMNQLKSNALKLALVLALLWQPAVYAQEVDVAILTPVINFLLEGGEGGDVQCPSLDEITGINIVDPDFTSGSDEIFSVINSGGIIFDADSLAEFLRSGPSTGAGNIIDVINNGNGLGSSNQLFGRIEILDQDDVNELEGIIQIVGELVFNTSLLTGELDLSPLNSLVDVTGQISLTTSNAKISGFRCLSSVGGDLNIQNNQNLISIDGFQSLESIGQSLSIQSNASLDGLGSLASLSRSDVNGNIIITNNTSFDCANPLPEFDAATSSTGNTVNCSEDLDFRTISEAITININEATAIPDLGSVSSTTTVPALLGLSGLVSSLTVNLDITHTSVGDLTVTLSNGTTTVDLLDRPTSNSALRMEIIDRCAIGGDLSGFFTVDGLEEFLITDFEAAPSGVILPISESLDANCVFDFLSSSNDDEISVEVTNQCANTLITSDFLNNEIFAGIELSDEFASFVSIDTSCIFGILSAVDVVNEPQFCSSDNISAELSNNASLFPINTSCTAGDLIEAYPLPSYSSLQSLDVFEGSNVNDAWTLTVSDSVSGDIGALNGWSITFNIDR